VHTWYVKTGKPHIANNDELEIGVWVFDTLLDFPDAIFAADVLL